MKKTIFIAIFVLNTFAFTQTVGEKVYKEVTVNGEKNTKWLQVYSVSECDSNGNIIHEKNNSGEEWWVDYDSKGNVIHEKSNLFDGYEVWREYDSKGNVIHEKSNLFGGYEVWHEYDNNGNIIYKKNNYEEFWYEYDGKGNKIYEKCANVNGKYLCECWYEYDGKGKKIYEKLSKNVDSNENFEEWNEFIFWENGNVKTIISFRPLKISKISSDENVK